LRVRDSKDFTWCTLLATPTASIFKFSGTQVLSLNQLVINVQLAANEIAVAVQCHPRRLTAAVAALLLGTGATAFAVANLAPDVSAIPVRMVLEAVTPVHASLPQPLALLSSNSASDAAPSAPVAALTLYRTDATRSNDTAEALLRRLGLVDPAATAFIKSDAASRAALLSRPGRIVTAETDTDNHLVKLQARWTRDESPTFDRLVLEKSTIGTGPQFTSKTETAPLVAGTRLAGGVIRSSLFAATDDARIPDAVATQIAELFAGDIDFHRALRKGDRFNVVYETLQADNEPLRAGRVTSAEFVNNGKTYQAVWFQEPGSKGQYYTLDGNSLRKAFLASPLEFSRITSGFGGRTHPISRLWKQHNGVDYAAPVGTAVRTVGDGVVEFAGVQRGYGNVIEVKHRDGKSTLFAHLSRIGVKLGQKVEQGDVIGAVGTTGYSTGPHLHFEFRVSGVHHDPLTIASENNSVPLSAASRPEFNRMASEMRLKLAAAGSMAVATAQ
jgi:murein DD-endopeptidase MepM/ murein hydrolase activator NlpD